MAKKLEDKKIISQEELEKLQTEFEALKQSSEQLDNQLKRAVADYRNLEARVNQGRSELTSFVGAELIKRLLPVLDHLEQSVTGVKATAMSEQSESNGWVKGVELAVKEFKQVLAQEGLEEIVTDGQFDPSLHEAVDTRQGDDNMILEVVRKGYNLNGKILRPAGVVVGRKEQNNG